MKNVGSQVSKILAAAGLASILATANANVAPMMDEDPIILSLPSKKNPPQQPTSVVPVAVPRPPVAKTQAPAAKKTLPLLNKIDRIVPTDLRQFTPPFADGQKLTLKNSTANIRDIQWDTFRPIAVVGQRDYSTMKYDGNRSVKYNQEMNIRFYPVTIALKNGNTIAWYVSSILVGELKEAVKKEVKKPVENTTNNEAILAKIWQPEDRETFRKDIRNLQPYEDRFEMYEIRSDKEEFKKIMENFGLSTAHIPAILHISAHLAKHESNGNFGARGITITNRKSAHFGDRAIGGWQFMPHTWAQASQKNFGVILPPTPINQEKVGFSMLAEYYKKHKDSGLTFAQICGKIAIHWYGSGTVMEWQPTPTQYAKGFLTAVLSDKEIIKSADTLLKNEKKTATVVALHQHVEKPVIEQVAFQTKTLLDVPAVNDPSYYKSSAAIQQGMSKVVMLKKYLVGKSEKTETEKKYAQTLTSLGEQMVRSDAQIVQSSSTGNTKDLIEHQLRKWKAIVQAMQVTQKVAPKEEIRTALAAGITETTVMIEKVVDFNAYLRERARKDEIMRREAQISLLADARLTRARGPIRKAA